MSGKAGRVIGRRSAASASTFVAITGCVTPFSCPEPELARAADAVHDVVVHATGIAAPLNDMAAIILGAS